MSIKGYLKDHGICILIFLIGMGITEGIFLLFNVSITPVSYTHLTLPTNSRV